MLPLATVKRIAKKAGVERISEKAVKALARIAEELGEELALEAAQVARHAKRKTILGKDIKFVAEKS
jgi:histone H3/H4